MPSNVLTDAFRRQLEQERLRLINERDTIVQAAINQATAEIDRSLDCIDALLGVPTAHENNGSTQAKLVEQESAPSPKQSTQRKVAAQKAKPSSPTPKQKDTQPSKQASKSEPAAKSKPAAQETASLKDLKREFKDLTPAQAIERVIMQSPKQVFTTEDVIRAIYGTLDQAAMPKARQSVALMLSHGKRRGDYIKVQEEPAQFQANPEKMQSA